MEKNYIAKWETKCGKDFVKMYETSYAGKKRYYYDTRTGGGNVGNKAPTFGAAIDYLEAHVIPFIKADHQSLRRTL